MKKCRSCGFAVGAAAQRCPDCKSSLAGSRRKRRGPPRADKIRGKFNPSTNSSVPQPEQVVKQEPGGCFPMLKSGMVFLFKAILFLVVLVAASQLHESAKKKKNDYIFRRNMERLETQRRTRMRAPVRTRKVSRPGHREGR